MTKREFEMRKMSAIGERLKATREALNDGQGLSVTELAKKIGISHNRYSQWESGTKRPSLDGAMRLCDTFGYTLDWIYLGDPSGLRHNLTEALGTSLAVLTGKS